MYLSGQIYDFEQRLHQLPTSTGDLHQFCQEARGYDYSPQFFLLEKWDKEFFKKSWIFGVTGNFCSVLDTSSSSLSSRSSSSSSSNSSSSSRSSVSSSSSIEADTEYNDSTVNYADSGAYYA